MSDITFDQLNLEGALIRATKAMGFKTPTPIQAQSLPHTLAGKDVLGAAMTGSGKTAAFVLPILQRFIQNPIQGKRYTRALVLTPTRELAAQVHEQVAALGQFTKITSTTVFGGVKQGPQERALRQGMEIVVATPGRLLDLMAQGIAKFDGLEVLVLDEADRMLDMGFLPDIKRVLKQLPADRQTLFYSATMPAPIQALSRQMLINPERIGVERKAAPAKGITQEVLPVDSGLKRPLLLKVLEHHKVPTALVFTRTKHRANRLADWLGKKGIKSDRIHGNRSQNQRVQALKAFKDGKLQVLVATDIAARGIDVKDMPFVINFDVPVQAEDYIHRVGRTARAETTGHAITLAAPEERKELHNIERAVGKTLPKNKLEGFDYNQASEGKLEIPIRDRIAAIRARKAEERARSRAKAERKDAGPGEHRKTGSGQGNRRRSEGQAPRQPGQPSSNRRRRRGPRRQSA